MSNLKDIKICIQLTNEHSHRKRDQKTDEPNINQKKNNDSRD